MSFFVPNQRAASDLATLVSANTKLFLLLITIKHRSQKIYFSDIQVV